MRTSTMALACLLGLGGLLGCSSDVDVFDVPMDGVGGQAGGVPVDDDGGQGGQGGSGGSTMTGGVGGMLPMDSKMTWGQCRTRHLEGALSAEERADCDLLHRVAPTTFRYGVRWVVLDDQNPGMMAEVEKHLVMVNKLYAPLGMSFETSSYVLVPEPTLDLFENGDVKVTLRGLASDVAAYLNLQETEPEKVLPALVARLRGAGVAQKAAESLTLDEPMPSQRYWEIIARAFGEEIVVFVGRPSTIMGRRGVSAPPRGQHGGVTTSPVFLQYASMPNMHGTLAHELGHYFGLLHTHQGGKGADEAVVQRSQLAGLYGGSFGGLQGLKKNFWSLVSESGVVADNFIAYDATGEEIETADRQRMAAQGLLPAWKLTYSGALEPYAKLEDFIADIHDSESTVYLKNFMTNGMPNNNCVAIEQKSAIECSYKPGGDSMQTALKGDDSFLAESVTSADGTAVNLMSYIRPGKTSHDDSRHMLSSEQLDVVRLGAVAPPRLNLRNRALNP